jgi:outer membrane protein assembly factor BamB
MTTAPAPTVSARPLFPGWPVRIILALAIGAIAALRLSMRLEDPIWPSNDIGLANILTLILAFIAALTAWIWFSFFSGLPRLARLLVLLSPLALVVLFAPYVGLLRLKEVNGDMEPTFVPRWTTTHDRMLSAIETTPAGKTIDLTTTTPDDFPQFLGPQRSCWLPQPELARDWSKRPPKLLWKRPIGAGWSAFAAVNGYAVTQEQRGENEWITCYEIATGNPVWGQSIAARHENPLGGIGPRATPTIHGGRVYAMGATGVVHCLDGATGKVIWHDDLLARFGNLPQAEFEAMVMWGRAGSPLIVDDLVVVPAGGPLGQAKNLVAYKAQTGEVAWSSEVPHPEGGSSQIAYASPALATVAGVRQILIVNEGTASGHDLATGKCLWSHPWPGHSNGDGSASQVVAIGADQVLLSKGYSEGAELLQLTPAENGLLTPQTVWKNQRALQTKFTNLVIYEDHAYGLSEGILECASLADGMRKWKHTRGRYGNGQILGVGKLLLVLAEDGRLALVELTPQKFSELGSIQALEGTTWNNLCLYGRLLLIRNGTQAACFELP